MRKLYLSLLILLTSACQTAPATPPPGNDQTAAPQQQNFPPDNPLEELSATSFQVEFAQYNPIYRFSAQIPQGWQVEYIPEIESLNIFDPSQPQSENIEKSQIFMRYFSANTFLTLQTVDILSRTETKIGSHTAVKYEIIKKSSTADFPKQPAWRNIQHKLIDIRLAETNPSSFYVFSYNPVLPTEKFEEFISSLGFHNDPTDYKLPIVNAQGRITKKPFGIQISPESSPVQPERFSGWHTGTDFETTENEQNLDIPITPLCSGRLIQKKFVEGYGGVAIQECLLENEKMQVLYGHLKLESIQNNPGDYLITNIDTIGLLGQGFSPETDNERKHLHLSIHKSSNTDLRGYVESENELKNWLNSEEIPNIQADS